ncbi:SAC3/GANP/Nin1/mts3/eIF-3 p25 family-domain-containing protein [Hypoxylon sp. FL0890]|nr:SAC3/GANP/Nin1/mts3/eIF-3 p25 family-domain-containing protein [Hypoxylon sp. FL0890]
MQNPESQGGWGVGPTPNPPSNPFARPMPSQPAKANPFAQSPFSQTRPNPFLTKQQNGVVPTSNPFLSRPASNPFQAPASTGQKRAAPSPFDQQRDSIPNSSPFGKPSLQGAKPTGTTNGNSSTLNPFSKTKSAFNDRSEPRGAPNANGKNRIAEYVQPAWPKQTAADSAPKSQINGKRKSENDVQRRTKFSRKSPDSEVTSTQSRSTKRNTKRDTSLGDDRPTALKGREEPDVFEKKIRDQLERDNIRPPQWPQNPGCIEQRKATERLREAHKAYREKARMSLMRAGLIDDPDKRRRLDEALTFKGICQDMCPEWECITRIVEHDIKDPEKEVDEHGHAVAIPDLMVKRLARSAAGQDAPLPMDVRSIRCLKDTFDYLIDLIYTDDQLPLRHSFLWDRTRAIRIDFSFQKYAMTPNEIKQQIYTLEGITRFHVISLHLLSRDGCTPADFSEQQEVEQLGKTLISLMEVYDECAQQGIKCENEPEFRGYYIVFNAFNPSLMERITDWDRRFGGTQHINSAISIKECIKNIQRLQGPLNPGGYSQQAIDIISVFFEIIKTPAISYTMACFAEIHFNTIRKVILKLIKRSFSRPKFGPKDLTPALLKQHMYTDTEEEAVSFFEKHGFEFDDQGGYAILCPAPEYTDARIRHSFSEALVERKRSGRSFQEIVKNTVFELNVEAPPPIQEQHSDEEEESLFVSDSEDVPLPASNNQAEQSRDDHGNKAQSSEPTPSTSPPAEPSPRPLPPVLGNHAVTKPNQLKSRVPFQQSPSPTLTFAQPPTKTDNGSPSQSTPNGTFVATEQPSTSAFSQAGQTYVPVSTPLGQPATFTFPQAGQTHVPASTPMGQPTTSIFAQSGKDIEAQPTGFVLPSTMAASGTNLFSNFQGPAQSSFAQSSTSTTKKVRFDSIPEAQPPAATNGIASPGLFNFLNNKDGHKDPAASSTPPNTSLFSGLLPNKDVSQGTTSFNASPILGLGSNSTAQPPVPSCSPISSLFTKPQPSGPAATLPSTSTQQQVTESSVTPTSSVPPVAHSHSSANGPLATIGPALPSQKPESTDLSAPRSAVQNDPMDNFAKWFVCGDRGLMETQLQQIAIEHVLKDVWDKFQAAEKERVRKEEEEKSWAIARQFREKNLQVKYFYRWNEGFRKRKRIRRMKMEKEKARQWRLPENVAKRERAEKEAQDRIIQGAKDSMIKTSRRNVDEAVKLRESTGPNLESRVRNLEDTLTQSSVGSSSLESRIQSIEDALIATGVFRGVRDERAAARYAAREGDGEVEAETRLEQKMRLRLENHDRLRRGLRPLKALPEPKVYKEGSKTAMLRSRNRLAAAGDSLSMSTGSLRGSTFSSSYRSSLGFNSSRVSKPRSRVTDPYWRLKASGLVRMPNGEYLHESIAKPMLEGGKRIPGFGDYGLPPVESNTPGHSTPPPSSRYSLPVIHTDGLRPSGLSTPSSGSGNQKRKRRAEEDDMIPNGTETPPSMKRARNGETDDSVTNAEEHLSDIANLLKRVEGSLRASTPNTNKS